MSQFGAVALSKGAPALENMREGKWAAAKRLQKSNASAQRKS